MGVTALLRLLQIYAQLDSAPPILLPGADLQKELEVVWPVHRDFQTQVWV